MIKMHFPCCQQAHECVQSRASDLFQTSRPRRDVKVQGEMTRSNMCCCGPRPVHIPKGRRFTYQELCELTNSQSFSNHPHEGRMNDVYDNSYNNPHSFSRKPCLCYSSHSNSTCHHYDARIIAPQLGVQQSCCPKTNCSLGFSSHFPNFGHNSCNVSSCMAPEGCCSHRTTLQSTAKRRTSNDGGNTVSRDENIVSWNRNISLISEKQVVICGWYYGKLSWQEAETKLKECDVGTFLLRDSSDPRYKYSLSVQTHKGPTSVRIVSDSRGFSLDSDPGSRALVFPSIHDLVQHYVSMTPSQQPSMNPYSRSAVVPAEHVWLDSSGSVVDSIRLIKPAHQNPPSLKHLIRLMVNKNRDALDLTALPLSLQHYVEKYPFWC